MVLKCEKHSTDPFAHPCWDALHNRTQVTRGMFSPNILCVTCLFQGLAVTWVSTVFVLLNDPIYLAAMVQYHNMDPASVTSTRLGRMCTYFVPIYFFESVICPYLKVKPNHMRSGISTQHYVTDIYFLSQYFVGKCFSVFRELDVEHVKPESSDATSNHICPFCVLPEQFNGIPWRHYVSHFWSFYPAILCHKRFITFKGVLHLSSFKVNWTWE